MTELYNSIRLKVFFILNIFTETKYFKPVWRQVSMPPP
jgi:hypothetical protein